MSTDLLVPSAIDGKLCTTTRRVAEKFGKQHRRVLQTMQKLLASPSLGQKDRHEMVHIFYTDQYGRQQPEYELSRKGFSILAMSFTGDSALHWKIKFIDAFEAMEAELLKRNDNLEWKAARLQIKQTRKGWGDTIQEFVEYATKQGSSSAHHYYASITKMEYKALDILEQQKTALGNFRDTLDLIEIGYLNVAENVAQAAIRQGMEQNMHYKEVYHFAKQKVTAYAESISFARLAEPCDVPKIKRASKE